MSNKAVATFQGPKIYGHVLFSGTKSKTQGANVTFRLEGFEPHDVKAIHVHEFGDMRKGCISLGNNWNPHNKTHGNILLDGNNRHSGDLISNINANHKGKFAYKYFDPLINVTDILGRSVVIHDGIDDLGRGKNHESHKSGNAGMRMSCAVIGKTK
jgi:Cu/Zn superoxide dismutase